MARIRPGITGNSEPSRFPPGSGKGTDYYSRPEPDHKGSKPSKKYDPFDEDKHLMSQGPVADYSFVYSKWVPTEDYPSSTEWIEDGDEIEFRVMVRTFGGPVRAIVRTPILETKAGKEAYVADVRKRLQQELRKNGMETK